MKKVFLLLLLVITSCNDETSLQEYYVEHQADDHFIAFDVPASLLTGGELALDPEQRSTLESIRKLNILAFPKKDSTRALYEKEKKRISQILKDGKYHQLFRYGGNEKRAELYYLGEDDAIDELIVFGSDSEKGFGIARVTGDDMDPEALIRLFRSLENKNELNLEGLPELDGFFKD